MKIAKNKDRYNLSGLAIKELRKKRKMTQDQLAAKMQLEGIPLEQRAISRIESGKRVVADYELKYFAKVLGVPVDFLLKE